MPAFLIISALSLLSVSGQTVRLMNHDGKDIVSAASEFSDENGDTGLTGVLQIYRGYQVDAIRSNEWISVCDNYFDDTMANLVCQELGYAYSNYERNVRVRNDDVFWGDVSCSYTDTYISKLTDCSFKVDNCEADEHVIVSCGESPTALDAATSSSGSGFQFNNTWIGVIIAGIVFTTCCKRIKRAMADQEQKDKQAKVALSIKESQDMLNAKSHTHASASKPKANVPTKQPDWGLDVSSGHEEFGDVQEELDKACAEMQVELAATNPRLYSEHAPVVSKFAKCSQCGGSPFEGYSFCGDCGRQM